jgi:PAS domain S-box-containing protein
MASRTAFEFSDYDKLFFRVMTGRVTGLLVQQKLRGREREARAETQRLRAQLDSLFAASPTGIAFFDREMRYLRLNDALAAVNGRPVHEHLGRSVREMIPEVAHFLEPLFRDILDTGRAVTNLEVSAALPSSPGEVRWWIANYHPVLGEDGTVLGICGVLMEITGRKRAEAQLRDVDDRLRFLSEGVGDHAFFTVDPQGRVSGWNPGAERVYGWAGADIVGQPVAALYVPEDAAAGKPERLMKKVEQEGFAEVTCTRVRKDGSRFVAHVTVSAVRDETGRPRGFASVTCVASGTPPPAE